MSFKVALVAVAGAIWGCSDGCDGLAAVTPDPNGIDLGEAGPYVDGGALDAGWSTVDGGYVVGEAGTVRADRFITTLVKASYGPCAGWGQGNLPAIIQGRPMGGGAEEGSVDVLSLGNGGSLVVSFEPNAIVDGPGVDFMVFENPFWIGGNPQHVYAEPGVVSVSDDGVTWKSFPCTATNASGGPFKSCAGHNPVYSSPANGISPFDPSVSGGEAFDLADVGLTHARYVKIVD